MFELLSFRETKAFTRDVVSLLSEENYQLLQRFLQQHHALGAVIPGGGGLRKMRWLIHGKGKRGGVRIIYFAALSRGYIYLLAIYGKNQQADLDKKQLKDLADQVKRWLE